MVLAEPPRGPAGELQGFFRVVLYFGCRVCPVWTHVAYFRFYIYMYQNIKSLCHHIRRCLRGGDPRGVKAAGYAISRLLRLIFILPYLTQGDLTCLFSLFDT